MKISIRNRSALLRMLSLAPTITIRSFFSAMSKKAIPFLDTFRPQDLYLLIDAFANTGHDCEDLFDEASKIVIQKVEYFTTGSLCRFAGSFAMCGYKNPDVLDVIAEKEILFLHTLDPQPLSQLLLAFVAMDHVHESLFQTAKAAVIRRMPSYDPVELITITSAFSNVNNFDMNDVFTTAAEAAELILDYFHPQEVAKLMEIFSRMDSFSESSDHLFCMIASRILSNPSEVARWDSRDLVDVAVAFAKGGVRNTKLLEVIGRTILDRGVLFPPMNATTPATRPATTATTVQRLLTAFAGYETQSAVVVMEFLFVEFMSLDKTEIEFSLVMDIAEALPNGQRNEILPHGIFQKISDIALAEGTETEVCVIFQKFAQLGFEEVMVSSKCGGSNGRKNQKE
mmetsp:Transcript_11410/g.27560  ORF Transcript_11410/g.27560 Transcript_11410/m.27560 type:complete len:398 (+) Transcript_11410:3149-4342(+)